MENKYVEFHDLKVYKLSRELSKIAWTIYDVLDWEKKKIIGDQFIRAVDSVGANIAEGYGRYGFQDKIRFYHIGRGSLLESRHWTDLMFERKIINDSTQKDLLVLFDNLGMALNVFISATKKEAKEWQ